MMPTISKKGKPPANQASNISRLNSSLKANVGVSSPPKPTAPRNLHRPRHSRTWTTLTSPIFSSPNSTLKLTWYLHNPTLHSWTPPIILSMLICKSSPASAMFGAWTNSDLAGDQVLLRTKCDLQSHEDRYEYLTETLDEPITSGEAVEISAEIAVPEMPARYWGCFKIDREGEREFYCAFRFLLREWLP